MKLMVLDGNSIVNRAFYGIRLLTTRDGTPTNAVYGFLNILQKLINEEAPDALCVTFDLKGPTFRHEQYEKYKAQRKAMPDELAIQMPILKEVLDAMNVPRYELEGWEADDLIGTIAKRCEGEGWECVIVTGDKDSFQLVTDLIHVRHVKTRMGQTETREYDVAEFRKEYGFAPVHMIDLKALMGDPSDNIPGVAGVGEKTAMDLIQRFGTVEEIFENLETLDIKDAVRKKLDAGREMAKMSFTLASISCDAPIHFEPSENTIRPVQNDVLYALFQRLEFNRLTDKFNLIPPIIEGNTENQNEVKANIIVADTEDLADQMITALKKAPWAAVFHDESLAVIAVNCGRTTYVIKREITPDFDRIQRVLFSAEVKKAGHDIKETQRRLLERKITSEGWIFDTAIAAYLLSPTENNYELGRLAANYSGYQIYSNADENGQISLQSGEDVDAEVISKAEAIGTLLPILEHKLHELNMTDLFKKIELRLCSVLAEMELEGFLVDRQALVGFSKLLEKQIGTLEESIYEHAGEQFNINSPKQLSSILFEKLMLPSPKKTKTGYSTNADVLEFLLGKHPIIKMIMEYRQLAKLKSTYADGLVKVIAPDGRIHTSFQMTVTATGRLSSTEPNLQNIPIRSELGGEIRKMFVAPEGNVLVDADYSQIELRLLAHISGDKTMQNAFLNGEDIHTVTASQVFDIEPKDVTTIQRSRAKAVNFGIVYGISAFSLAQDIGVSVSEAKHYIENYLSKYHGVRDYMKNVVEQAKTDGYVTTLFNRRRYLPELNSSNFNVRAFGERVALNMPIQGTAADIMKLAMVHVSQRLKSEGLTARLLLQVHDELIAECPEHEAAQVARILDEEMEHVVKITVPLIAESHIGKSWYEAK